MANISQNVTNSTLALTPPPLPRFAPFFVEPLGLLITRLTIEVAIAVAGLLGNLLVIIVIASKRLRGRSPMHSFIMNLAFADIGVLIIIFPIAVMKERMPFYWPFGKIVCLYVVPWVDTFYGASIWLITSIAFQRYISIVKASEHLHHEESKRLPWCLAGVWLGSFMIVSLPLFFIMTYIDTDKYNICLPDWQNVQPFEPIYIITLVVFTYVLPLAIISWTYIGIWREIRKSTMWHQSRRTSGSASSDTEHQRMKENARARKILTPIVVTFATCMLPVNIFRLLTYFWPPVLSMYHFWTVYNVVVVITTLNSAVNPLIYSIVSQEFRRAFMGLCFNVWKREKHSTYTQITKVNGHSAHGSHGRQKDLNFSPLNWPEAKTLKESVI